ncbi:MAG: two-component system sensor histidine kinase CreC [Akkermansiaceae bacterium]|jgi:two-component system sensor histidine kinase CreC|nr:two-component system sensor histidine kinase CreC [Luteolibacter sp.]
MSLTLRFIIAVLLLCNAAWFAIVNPVLGRVERQYLEAAEEPMVDFANFLAEIASDRWEEAKAVPSISGALKRAHARHFEAKIYEVVKSRVDMHVAITDLDGTVLFDSIHPDRIGKPHNSRDVRLTLAGSYGARMSRSDPNDPLSAVMYVAAPVRDKDGKMVGVLSLAKPQLNLLVFIEQTKNRVKAFALVGGVAALLLGILLARWIAEPLRELTRHAEAVAGGARPAAPRLPGYHLKRLGEMMEEMRDALEGKRHVETYVRNLTHEMKSPVAAIRGAVELLYGTPTESQREKLLANIESESRRLELLGDQLLALANLESRKQLDQSEEFDLKVLVHRTVDSKTPNAQNHGIEIHIDPLAEARLHGDATLIELGIANLLQNAIDFSEDGSTITVKLRCEENDALIEIFDQGIGLPDFAYDRAFDRFFSMPRPRTGHKSSGLGLCFVRETAQLHGGEITLGPNQPTGTVATLRLPRVV